MNCSSCGYAFEAAKLKQTGTGNYCRVCQSIGAQRVNENPNAFGDAKYFLPPLAWCVNYIVSAIATRAESGDVPTPSKSPVFVVLSSTAELVELQDAAGNPVGEIEATAVEGTDFRKLGPFYLP